MNRFLTCSAFLRRLSWRRRMYSDLTLRLHSSRLREGAQVGAEGLGVDGTVPVPEGGAVVVVSSMALLQKCTSWIPFFPCPVRNAIRSALLSPKSSLELLARFFFFLRYGSDADLESTRRGDLTEIPALCTVIMVIAGRRYCPERVVDVVVVVVVDYRGEGNAAYLKPPQQQEAQEREPIPRARVTSLLRSEPSQQYLRLDLSLFCCVLGIESI